MKSISSEGVLFPVYFLMIGVAVCLNVFGGSSIDVVNVVMNIVMFLIIGSIILWANTKCFMPVNKMMSSLRSMIQTMEIDFMENECYLWDKYKNQSNLFHNRALNERFNEYKEEKKLLDNLSSYGNECDVEDYINEYYIDAALNKGLLSIIPGVMTGLGILGTFVGLSFGLQNFNTGNAAEITNSIAPLMDGIKVAFHTSIYGMVFSLLFNFVYKKNIEDAYNTIDRFIESYHKYVLPKTENDNLGMLLAFEERNRQQMQRMMDSFSDDLSVKLAEAIKNPYSQR